MTLWLRPFRVFASLALILSLVCQGTLVLAGTTGALSGILTDAATHTPSRPEANATGLSPTLMVPTTAKR